MRLTILGGGGFRVPLVYRAVLDDPARTVSEVTLYDTDARRAGVIAAVLERLAQGRTDPVPVRVADGLDEALRGAGFVFCAIRVGGTAGRVRDERIPLDEGVLGQETVGAGGVLYGLRTIPVALEIAERVAALAPDAWVINFTNPAGMVTEAMAQVLGERVIGICDSPAGLVRHVARAAGAGSADLSDGPAAGGTGPGGRPAPGTVTYDYVGLNHLGWLRSFTLDGRDLLPGLLADDRALASFEAGRLFGADWLRALGAIPNEYLHYYYFRRETLRAVQEARQTRGAFLDRQQGAFFTEAAAAPDQALELWERTRREREETYMADAREAGGGWQREECDLEGGGYDRVALALMHAIAQDRRGRLILNVRNGATVPQLAPDAIIETVCEVSAHGPRPLPCAPLREDQLGLMLQVKAVERATVEAATFKDRHAALRALALHPLVDSPAVAARILERAATA
ncbi:6-phospho-beta-glucosidase [Streptomyces sp. MST-110588]|uniref:family 4 glycosyl hydrolase n=1 Tax=Streptomyces sp. MST-110588 TaxID=2833628 RepID=UPI001F5C0B33|nr:6-phospho-beta-glucosidase [Streptomyces sp. MST-110588]UNO42064.1 6-phospho-beta-glucosidase [Streptomyces sp. MST-110588]